jgi:hypothetical protein
MLKLSRIPLLAALACSTFVSVAQEASPARSVEDVLPLVNRYCGACHAVPRPDVQPRGNWPALIRIMVEIMQQRTGRAQLSEQQMKDIIAFYYGSSPETLPLLPYPELPSTNLEFVPRTAGATSTLPFVTHVDAVSLGPIRTPQVLVGDGEAKRLVMMKPMRGRWSETTIGDIEIPVHTQALDFDGDGDQDVLTADLGKLPPMESKAGKVVLLRQMPGERFQAEVLQSELGRVSDVRAADLDADGDLDLAVAVFGGGDVGEIFWLRNEGTKGSAGPYTRQGLFSMSGAISIEPADLNGDGRLDLVSLVAQEHEMVVAFMNRGGGEFVQHMIARAPHPMYGCTSARTVDLDRDGDLDILFTNGDAFDAQTDPKPYHGVQWLENRGEMRFEIHDIGRFYGASSAAAGDVDGDGDLDVVAGSWVSYWQDPRRFAVVWFENDGQQRFTPHGVATRPAGVSSLQLVDVTGDGRLDIVAGAIRMDLLLTKMGSSYRASRHFPPSSESTRHPRVVVFENRRLK